MQNLHQVSEDQAHWLRVLENQQYLGTSEQAPIPEDILKALLEMGFIHRWSDGGVAITLGGIREVAQH